jgi:hypothetical protein
MKISSSIFTVLLGVFIISQGDLFPANDTDPTERLVYGHISLLEGAKGEVKVIRQDQGQDEAVINLPIAPGDTLVTGGKGRCELQFDNGTIIRLDKNTRLKVTTVLAKSLTTDWKISTLNLEKGRVFAMSTPYNQEIFQIVTHNAAAKLKSRSLSTIHINKNGDTQYYCLRGKFSVLWEQGKSLKTHTIRSGKGGTITADRQMLAKAHPDIDFMTWNERINENFKELHYGISKLPKAIYRGNRAIIRWAEKWSSKYGEWVYHDTYGYTWKPYDKWFHYNRPFFNADYVNINGVLFLVPQEPWGWVPAHLGTWVFIENMGWVWVPGQDHMYFPGLWNQFWGHWLYGMYTFGWDYWDIFHDIYIYYHTYYGHKPVDIRERLKGKINNPATGVIPPKTKTSPVSSRSSLAAKAKIKTGSSTTRVRDWNPDTRWAVKSGFKVEYSSKNNEVICPKLGAYSSEISYRDRVYLRRSGKFATAWSGRGKRSSAFGPGGSGGDSGGGSSGTKGSPGSSAASHGSHTGTSVVSNTGSSSGSAGSSKEKQ